MREGREDAERAERNVPENLVIYRLEGAYERRHICRHLRDLPENSATEAEEADRTTLLTPSRYFPVGR
jgi:hypothetical protein